MRMHMRISVHENPRKRMHMQISKDGDPRMRITVQEDPRMRIFGILYIPRVINKYDLHSAVVTEHRICTQSVGV